MGFSFVPVSAEKIAEIVAQVAAKADASVLDISVVTSATRLIQTQSVAAQIVAKGQ